MRTLTVGAVMTRDPYVVSPEAEFKDVAVLLAQREISAVPVVGDDGTLLGVVSEADLLPKEEYAGDQEPPSGFARSRTKAAWHKAGAVRARELMTAPAQTVDVGEPLPAVARRLGGGGLRRLFVLENGKLVGVVARRDLLGAFLRPDEQIKADVETEVFGKALGAAPGCYSVTVHHGEVMLLGRLEYRSSAAAAGSLTASVPGVVEVCNRLGYVWDDGR
ncbi:CBS domain-containing protein [Amycolatopsis sacchari]|uniref:CBS domain-containing protein n=1 Tax=Amycolatopsis sacchari TaxID=115433 RepID=UPI003D759918